MENCVFCKIVRGEIPCNRLFEGDNFIVIEDAHPKVDGHLLVIPKKHFKNLLDMPSIMFGDFLETAKNVSFKILKEKNATGFNLVMNNFDSAGQVVPHAHLHILPRREGDGFKVSV